MVKPMCGDDHRVTKSISLNLSRKVTKKEEVDKPRLCFDYAIAIDQSCL